MKQVIYKKREGKTLFSREHRKMVDDDNRFDKFKKDPRFGGGILLVFSSNK